MEESEIDFYDPDLAAQFAAYLLYRAGGRMEKLKLAKLMYLGERECIMTTGCPLFNDRHYSLPKGPICSRVNDALEGWKDSKIFSYYLRRKAADVILRDQVGEEDFDVMSEKILQIADRVFDRFADNTADEVVAFTHSEKIAEYRPTTEEIKRLEITDEALAAALGIDPESYVAGKREFEVLRYAARSTRVRTARYAT